eukprot:7208826-Karenia_brevis.AAC.1
MHDLHLVKPTAKHIINDGPVGLFAHSTGYWSDEGEWVSLQAHEIPQDALGRRLHLAADGLGRRCNKH